MSDQTPGDIEDESASVLWCAGTFQKSGDLVDAAVIGIYYGRKGGSIRAGWNTCGPLGGCCRGFGRCGSGGGFGGRRRRN